MLKSAIRYIYKDMRNDLSSKEIQNLSDKIKFKLFTNFNFNHIHTIHTYLPKLNTSEINTWNIVDNIWKFFPNISVIVPKIENNILVNYHIDENTIYKRNKYNILEPNSSKKYTDTHFDMILLPLLAYDKQGHRVGYGGGYYDKMLYHYSANYIVGLSFFTPIYEIKDINKYDVPLDCCITPSKIYQFSRLK
tara:strand:- start:3034 stop:3609 length:576 start_codon:yes stop_codon:yes gene_type:complete